RYITTQMYPLPLSGRKEVFSVKVNPDSVKQIYLQIAEWIETEILTGLIKEDEKVYSQYKLAEMFNINPATAAKGLNVLADKKILYDKRGIGKFVVSDAVSYIKEKRKSETLTGLITELVKEANHLQIDEVELIEMVKQVKREIEGVGK